MKNPALLIPAFCLLLPFTGCGSSGTNTTVTPITPSSIAIQLSSATLTVSQGSSGSATVVVSRTGTTGNVTLSLTGLPGGATAAYQNPAAGNSGQITILTTAAALAGTYPLTVQATDGTYSASSSLSLVIRCV